MTHFQGLELAVDRQLEKLAQANDGTPVRESGGVLGNPQSLGGAIGRAGLYMLPGVGSALSVADGVKDFRNGNYMGGLYNLGMGLATGVADLATFGAGGSALRAGAAALKGTRLFRALHGTKALGAVQRAGNAAQRLTAATGKARGFLRGGDAQTWTAARQAGRSIPRAAAEWAGRRVTGAAPLFGFGAEKTLKGNARMRGMWGAGGLLQGGVGTYIGNGYTWDQNGWYERNDPNYWEKTERTTPYSGTTDGEFYYF